MQVPITRLPRVAARVAKYWGPFLDKFIRIEDLLCVQFNSYAVTSHVTITYHMLHSDLTLKSIKLTLGLLLVYWQLRSSLKHV